MDPAAPKTPKPKPPAGSSFPVKKKPQFDTWLKIERAMFAPMNPRNAKMPHVQKTFQRWEREVANAAPPFRQCKHLIKCFGGIIPFAVAAGMYPDDIIKCWLSAEPPKTGNMQEYTQGLVPTNRLPRILAWARVLGIYLSGADIWPDFAEVTFSGLQEMMTWLKGMKRSKRLNIFETDLIKQMWKGA